MISIVACFRVRCFATKRIIDIQIPIRRGTLMNSTRILPCLLLLGSVNVTLAACPAGCGSCCVNFDSTVGANVVVCSGNPDLEICEGSSTTGPNNSALCKVDNGTCDYDTTSLRQNYTCWCRYSDNTCKCDQ